MLKNSMRILQGYMIIQSYLVGEKYLAFKIFLIVLGTWLAVKDGIRWSSLQNLNSTTLDELSKISTDDCIVYFCIPDEEKCQKFSEVFCELARDSPFQSFVIVDFRVTKQNESNKRAVQKQFKISDESAVLNLNNGKEVRSVLVSECFGLNKNKIRSLLNMK